MEIMNHHFSGSSFLLYSCMKQILQEIRTKYLALIYRAKQEVQFACILYTFIFQTLLCVCIVWSVICETIWLEMLFVQNGNYICG